MSEVKKREQDKNKELTKFLIALIIVVLITLLTSIVCFQPYMFFHPWHDSESYAELLEEESFEEVKIDNSGDLLSGWIKYNVREKPAPLLIFFAGNAENSSNMFSTFLKLDIFKYFGVYNMMIIDYPGYGLSDGKPSEKTLFDSGLKIYDYASQLDFVDKNNIVVLGYSIGTGVATYVSSQRNVNGLILVAPYDDALSLYNDTINIFHGPLKLLARYEFDSKRYAQDIDVAPLIITSYDDEIINYKFSLNLATYFKNVKKTIVLENKVKHSEYFLQGEVLANILIYLKERLSCY